MRKIMAIFAHPDDEGAMGGTLIQLAEAGHETILVCANRGEVGEISDPSLATPETLGEVREQELRNACKALGIKHLEFLDYRDSGMDGTEENNDPRAWVQADPDEAKRKIVKFIRQYQPEIVVTFEPFGWYGHPDHKITCTWVTEAFPLVSDASAYPEIEGAYQPEALYYSAFKFSNFKSMIDEAIAGGYITEDAFGSFGQPEEAQLDVENQITHAIDIGGTFEQQDEATMSHKTQFGEDNPFRKIPPEISEKYGSDEYFIQVYPEPDASLRETYATSLF